MTDQEPLPGIAPDSRRRSPLEEAYRRSLRELWRKGVLNDLHAGTIQLILDLAEAVDAGKRSGRASAVAMAAAQLREAWASLPIEVQAPSDDDPWEVLARELAAAAVRNPT